MQIIPSYLLFSIILLILPLQLWAQTKENAAMEVAIEEKLKKVFNKAAVLKVKPNGFNFAFDGQLLLKCSYGKASFANDSDSYLVEDVAIKRVTLLYSWHSSKKGGGDIKQKDLNMKRLRHLYDLAPQLFDDEEVEWEFVVQTDYLHPEVEKGLFHGFILHYDRMLTNYNYASKSQF